MKEARTISQYSDPFHQGEESSRGGDSGQWREAKTNSDRADRAPNIGPACQPDNATIVVKMIAILVHNTGMVGKKEENSMHKHMELFHPNVDLCLEPESSSKMPAQIQIRFKRESV